MILAQSTAIHQTVTDYQQFKELATRQGAIQNTAAALDELHKALAPLAVYPHLQRYLAPAEVDAIRQMAQRLVATLAALQRDFANRLDQRRRVEQERNNAEQLRRRMEQAWHAYAQPLVADLQQRYALVEHLPSIQRSAPDFQQTLRKLQRLATTLPEGLAIVEQFHQVSDQLRNDLQTVGDLTVAQQSFLQQVNHGSATLADVTPELLEWAKRQGMDSRLKITL